VDYSNATFIQYYREGLLCFKGTGTLEMPMWSLSDVTREVCGYTCHRATATYLGREWVVWYTEQVPLGVGPWLLWGAPGLIVKAVDAEQFVGFELMWAEEIQDDSRGIFMLGSYNDKKSVRKYFDYGIKEMERMHTKVESNPELHEQFEGIISSSAVDQNSNPVIIDTSYYPLIPDAYWSDK